MERKPRLLRDCDHSCQHLVLVLVLSCSDVHRNGIVYCWHQRQHKKGRVLQQHCILQVLHMRIRLHALRCVCFGCADAALC
jgi:hypothetical protein